MTINPYSKPAERKHTAKPALRAQTSGRGTRPSVETAIIRSRRLFFQTRGISSRRMQAPRIESAVQGPFTKGPKGIIANSASAVR